MKSALTYLFQSESAGDVIAFLRDRGPHAHVVAPKWVREKVSGREATSASEPKARWSEDIPEPAAAGQGATNYIVIADNADRERAIVQSLRNRKGVKVYGLFGHIVPALLCTAKVMSAGRSTAGLRRYAILCVPRSGSRYLSAVLSSRGVGAPKEHIREPLARIIAEGKLGFKNAVGVLEKFGQANEIFGTKLISTFLIRASHFKLSELDVNIDGMVTRGYQIVALERPLNETVISSYIAFLMRQWHFFGEMNEEVRARLDSLMFEDGAAWEEYLRFRSEKTIVDSIVKKFGLPKVQYTQIEADVESVVRHLCGIIGVTPEKLIPGSARIPIATRTESPTYALFAERLDALLDRRASEIEGAVVKKVSALATLGRKESEELVAAGQR